MLCRFLFLSCGLLILVFSVNSYAQTPHWKQAVGPQGQLITGSAAGAHGDLYIVARSFNTSDDPHHIWHTTNDGGDWEDVSGTIPLQVLNSISTFPNGDMYIGEYWNAGSGAGSPVLYPRTLYRSRNNGGKWDTVQENLTVITMAVAPNGLMYLDGAVNQQSGFLFRSLDSGHSWKNIQDPGMKYESFKPSYFSFDLSGNIFVCVQKALWRSSDSGKNWTKLPTLEIFQSPLQTLSNGNLITYGSYNSYTGLWISKDDGMNWDTLSRNAGPAFIVLPGDNICALRGHAVGFSPDAGKSWQTVTNNVPSGGMSETGWSMQFVPDGKGGCYYTGVDTVLHTDKDGNKISIFQSPSQTDVSAILIDDFGKMLFNGPGTHAIYPPAVSIDGGNSWEYLNTPGGHNCFDIWRYGKDSSGGLLAVKGGSLSRSLDSGVIWKEIRHAVATSSSDIHFTTSAVGAIYTVSPQSGLLRTTDLGTTWISIDEFGINKIQTIETAPDGSTIIGADNEIYRSKNLFSPWEITAHLKDTNFHLNPNLFLRTASIKSAGDSDVIVGTDGDGAIRSTDNGVTWSAIRSGAENAKIYEMAESKNGDIYALASFPQVPWIRVLYLPHHGPQWFDVSAGLGNTNYISSIAASRDGTVLIGTMDRGIFKLIDEPSSVPVSNSSKDDMSLALYPNPAATHCTITYSLPTREHITLQLCDPLGRVLIGYANEFEEAGEHSFNASFENLSNGMYFVRVSTSNGSTIGKLVINK